MQTGVLADIESEFAGMAAQLAESDTQAVAREAAVRVSREQWIRLNADFDNFRKRTVRLQSWSCRYPQASFCLAFSAAAVCVLESVWTFWCMLGASAVGRHASRDAPIVQLLPVPMVNDMHALKTAAQAILSPTRALFREQSCTPHGSAFFLGACRQMKS